MTTVSLIIQQQIGLHVSWQMLHLGLPCLRPFILFYCFLRLASGPNVYATITRLREWGNIVDHYIDSGK